jgi:hypothetical protein
MNVFWGQLTIKQHLLIIIRKVQECFIHQHKDLAKDHLNL